MPVDVTIPKAPPVDVEKALKGAGARFGKGTGMACSMNDVHVHNAMQRDQVSETESHSSNETLDLEDSGYGSASFNEKLDLEDSGYWCASFHEKHRTRQTPQSDPVLRWLAETRLDEPWCSTTYMPPRGYSVSKCNKSLVPFTVSPSPPPKTPQIQTSAHRANGPPDSHLLITYLHTPKKDPLEVGWRKHNC